MAIKIVTDSASDIPSALAKELGITLVPLYVLFGDKTYRDRVDITEDEFYQRLTNDEVGWKKRTPKSGKIDRRRCQIGKASCRERV